MLQHGFHHMKYLRHILFKVTKWGQKDDPAGKGS